MPAPPRDRFYHDDRVVALPRLGAELELLKLAAFTVGAGQKRGLRSIAVHESGAPMLEIDKAKHEVTDKIERPFILIGPL